MPAETQFAKATFTVQGGGDGPLEVQFNPVSLEHTIANHLQGEGGQAAQHVASSSAKLSMELVFDTTDTGADVRTRTNPVANLMKPAGGESEDAAKRGAPLIVVFEWGAFRFQGMVESFKETMDYFSANGVPLRATVSLTLNSQEHVFEAMGDTGRTAGVGGGLELPGGDPLLQHGGDQVEVGRHLVGGGAPEELLPLPQLDLHHLGQLRIPLQHAEVQRHQAPDLGHRVRLASQLAARQGHPPGPSAIRFRRRSTKAASFSRKRVARISSLVRK